jgi:queuine tRNA-ribosyltransferase
MITSKKVISPFNILCEDKNTQARLGELYTKHGKINTPTFMPVATQGSVKALSEQNLYDANVECILSNTYHLYLRPGMEVLKKMGGLHKFMNYKNSILTDSGGFQVYSLSHLCKQKQDGVIFRSHHDGSKHTFTPENVIEYQSIIGSDIWTCLDICVANPPDKAKAKRALKTTEEWLEKAIKKYFEIVPEQRISKTAEGGFAVKNSLLFGIVQGSIFTDLREQAAKHMAKMPVHGFCIGGLSVGEKDEDMLRALEVATANLPKEKPRYFMGLGTPEDIWESVERGVDMFDCVWPTRNARNGQAMTSEGKLYIKNTEYKFDESPLDKNCNCETCKNYSRAFLSHLYRTKELLSHKLISLHNIHFLMNTMKEIRQSIKNENFLEQKKEFLSKYQTTPKKSNINLSTTD